MLVSTFLKYCKRNRMSMTYGFKACAASNTPKSTLLPINKHTLVAKSTDNYIPAYRLWS